MRPTERAAAAAVTFIPGVFAICGARLVVGVLWILALCLVGDPIEAWLDARRSSQLEALHDQNSA
jgi:hypothetical protein